MRLNWFEKAELILLALAAIWFMVMFLISCFTGPQTAMFINGLLSALLGFAFRLSVLEAILKVRGIKLRPEDFMKFPE